MITARNVTVSYKEPVLNGLDVNLEPGLIHGLIGPNGSGKTTLMRVLAGQMPYGGSVSVFGQDPFDNEKAMDGIIFSGADMAFPTNWTATKILGIGAKRWVNFDLERALELLNKFEVAADKKFGKLSLGQKSAVAVVFGLAARCPFTLLDEPYLGIDVQRRELLYRLLLEEQEEYPRTILFSTHHINESARVLDTVHLLDDGHIYETGTVEDLTSGVLEVVGPLASVEGLNLGSARVLSRTENGGVAKLLVDARGAGLTLAGRNVRVSRTDLEGAVLALEEGR